MPPTQAASRSASRQCPTPPTGLAVTLTCRLQIWAPTVDQLVLRGKVRGGVGKVLGCPEREGGDGRGGVHSASSDHHAAVHDDEVRDVVDRPYSSTTEVAGSIPPAQLERLHAIFKDDAAIEEILSLHAVDAGPEEVIVMAEFIPRRERQHRAARPAMDYLDHRIRIAPPIVADVYIDVTASRGQPDPKKDRKKRSRRLSSRRRRYLDATRGSGDLARIFLVTDRHVAAGRVSREPRAGDVVGGVSRAVEGPEQVVLHADDERWNRDPLQF